MKIKILLKRLEGIQTISSITSILNISKEKAIYYVYRLKKQGYVKTRRLSNNKRVYNISFENRLQGSSYYEIINRYSPIKLASSSIHKIYGKRPSAEETLVYAIKTKSLRTILAALALFNKIEDWGRLYRLAKKNHVEREVGALYDLTRIFIRTRKMTKRFRNNSLPKKSYTPHYTIPGLRSKDFQKIEKTWKIYLPFNKKDLEAYA